MPFTILGAFPPLVLAKPQHQLPGSFVLFELTPANEISLLDPY